jgi:hypothetical protein
LIDEIQEGPFISFERAGRIGVLHLFETSEIEPNVELKIRYYHPDNASRFEDPESVRQHLSGLVAGEVLDEVGRVNGVNRRILERNPFDDVASDDLWRRRNTIEIVPLGVGNGSTAEVK